MSNADQTKDPYMLRHFLAALSDSIKYDDFKRTRSNVFKACYFALSGEGACISELFPGLDPSLVDTLRNYAWDTSVVEPNPFYKHRSTTGYTHAKGDACARILSSNVAQYRCSECFYDDTCVLCEDCFNPDDHKGHKVTKYASLGSGMCDCGDESAFLRKLNCKCLQVPTDTTISPALLANLELVIETVLDFIIDVGNRCILTLPEVNKYLFKHGTEEIMCDLMEFCSLPADKYLTSFNRFDSEWHLVMWKQGPEQYSAAEIALKNLLGKPAVKAKELSGYVRTNGSCVIEVSSSYAGLIDAQKKLQKDFVVTIQPSSQTLLENIVYCLLSWLQDISCSDWNFALKTQAKKLIGQYLLVQPTNQPSQLVLGFLRDKFSLTTINGFPVQDVYEGTLYKYSLKDDFEFEHFNCEDLAANFAIDRLSQHLTRLQLLLTYDLRFRMELRLKLDDLIILALMYDSKYKQAFALQFIDAFPCLLILLAAADRLVDDSCIQTISVQVFMCPPTNNVVVNSTKLANVLGPTIHLILSKDSVLNPNGFLNITRTEVTDELPEIYRLRNTIRVALDTITNMFSKNDADNILNALLEEKNFIFFTMFQSLIQGLGPVSRETTAHVEREDFYQANFVFRTAMTFLNIIKDANVGVDLNLNDIRKAVPIVLKLMSRTWNKNWNSSLEISKRPVSFINPVSFLLSILTKRAGFENVKHEFEKNSHLFEGIYDFALQSCVLAAQVKIGTWVRNGELLAALAAYYSGDMMSSLSHHNDFHLIQIAALTQDPEKFFYHLVDRWELISWLSNEAQVEKTVYDERFPFAFEQFIIFLYNLFTERCFFDEFDRERHELYVASKSLIYSLSEGPQTFSVLWDANKTKDMSVRAFEVLLREYADYCAPQGLLDSGVYRLKDSLLEKVDPISLFLDSGSSQSTFLSLVENIAKTKKADISKVILTPLIHLCKSESVNANIGRFLHTKLFAKFIHKALLVGLDAKDLGIIFPCLHLLHALLLEDERLYGKDYINEYFLDFPICNAFLFIADSQISPSITAKAELLLDLLISKDANVVQSLTSCFGEMHIQNYQAKRREPSEKKRKRSKDAAEARKAKILSKFAKQRQSFLDKNDLEDDIKRSDEQKAKCLACGEPECIDERFGVPFSFSTSTTSWTIPNKHSVYFNFSFENYWDQPKEPIDSSVKTELNEAQYKEEVVDLIASSQKEDGHMSVDNSGASDDSESEEEIDENLKVDMGPIFPKDSKKNVTLPFTCSHTIHEKCFLGTGSNGHFACPLCHLHFSRILPTYYYLHKGFVPEKWLNGLPQAQDHWKLQTNLDLSKNDDLLHSVLHEEYFVGEKLSPSVYKPSFDTFRLQKPDEYYLFERLQRITDLIGNSIRSHEMASRLDGEKGMSHFVDAFPSSAITLNRSMIQSRVLLFNDFKEDYSQMKLEELLSKFYSFNSRASCNILDVLFLFFQTSESLTTCFRAGLAKLIAHTLGVLCKDFLPFSITSVHISPGLAAGIRIITKLFSPVMEGDSEDIAQELSLYAALEKCIVPYLRQCVLLKHILTCERAGDNEYIIAEEFDTLINYNKSWTTGEYISCLCSVLGIRTLEDIIASSTMEDPPEYLYFEYGLLNSLIPEFKNEKDLRIEYPNVQRLVILPENYSEIRSMDNYVYILAFICLHCGEQLKCEDAVKHREGCASMSIFYGLKANDYYVGLNGSKYPYDAVVPGPYMTEHGEVKRDKVPGTATLNLERYTYMNKLWLNNEFHGIVLRSSNTFASNPLGLEMEESDAETDNELLDNWATN